MSKRFKGKRKVRFIYKFLIFIFFALASFLYIFNFLYNKFLKNIDNETLINYLVDYNLNTGNHNPFLLDILSLNSTDFLLKYTLGISPSDKESVPVMKEEEAEYIKDPFESSVKDPIVYIYNTHQTEGYQKNNDSSYNITPSVLMASYILRESLKDLGIPSLVETNNLTEILRINNWNYNSSYKASKLLLQDAKEKNSTLNYFIDLHRDSANYDISTTTINGEKYARVMFVMGTNYENEQNLKMAYAINNYIKEFDSNLSRGVILRDGTGTGGIFNQDVSPNAILIEVGGPYNTIGEVNNTLKILSKAIYKYIKGEI